MSILIVTEPDDIHAVLVKLALEKKGQECELFFSADMPSKQENSVEINNNNNISWTSSNSHNKNVFTDKKYKTIWWRRPRKPFTPDYVHKDDKEFINRENSIYHYSLPYLFNDDAWWINPYSSQEMTRSKLVQLKIAKQCGFDLPETLISNSPADIKEFILQNSDGTVIYKPFTPHFWADDQGMKILYTNKIGLSDLPSDKMLKAVTGIYQGYVEKKYEIRVTCFGTYLSAVKIDSQNHDLGKTDWRQLPDSDYSLDEVSLPVKLKQKIISFMKEIKIAFGCFDFIVTPDDEYIFLEVNEQGQFLWVEDINPNLCYLDIFTNYLIHADFNFQWVKHDEIIRSAELDKEAEVIVDKNLKNHVYLNQVKRVG